MFETIFSSSPLLERLKLVRCKGIEHLSIHAPHLKNYAVKNELKSICFKHTPNLTEVSIISYYLEENIQPGKASNLFKLLGALPRIEKLYLGEYFLKFLAAGSVPDRLPTNTNHLKILNICLGVNDVDEISCALCLIRSSPNLQELEISVSTWGDDPIEPVLNFLEAQDCINYTRDQLRIVKIKFIMGSKPQLELIKIQLARSPLLERMSIQRREFINSSVGLTMTKELTELPRASPKAEIIYLDLDPC
ncbi:hypothetical protein L1049_006741 [Liquidambar formosana]|uniref:FBD domain-containing protein n=1 Tax=Liquidambar formosana TaxID=63359 RepID=A0AAP0RHH1_LIQFO